MEFFQNTCLNNGHENAGAISDLQVNSIEIKGMKTCSNSGIVKSGF